MSVRPQQRKDGTVVYVADAYRRSSRRTVYLGTFPTWEEAAWRVRDHRLKEAERGK